MRSLSLRLIEKTRQQMQELGGGAAEGVAAGRRPNGSPVTADTDGAIAALRTEFLASSN